MDNDIETLSFGTYLKAIREQQNIPLSAVASEIRVGLWQLTLIENEAHDQLPDPVYVKGILKAYAACIGVDTDDILERFAINRRAYEKSLVSSDGEAGRTQGKKRSFFPALGLILAGVILCAIFFYVFRLLPGLTAHLGTSSYPASGEMSAHGNGMDVLNNPAPEKEILAAGIHDLPDRAVHAKKRLLLCVDVLSETDMNIQIDGISTKRLHLSPKDHIEFEAGSFFNIWIANASAVDLTLNGKPVSLQAYSGHPVNIVLSGKKLKNYG